MRATVPEEIRKALQTKSSFEFYRECAFPRIDRVQALSSGLVMYFTNLRPLNRQLSGLPPLWR